MRATPVHNVLPGVKVDAGKKGRGMLKIRLWRAI